MLATLLLSACAAAPQDAPVLGPHEPIRFGDDAAHSWDEPFVPGATYDPSVARPEEILGQAVGSRLASHDEVLACLRRLEETSPRVMMRRYGSTYEGRELVVCLISSPANLARLDAIQRGAARLWDPRGDEGIDDLIEVQPGIAWMGYGIHGDETSATEAAVPVAYHLAASLDADVQALLDQTVVVLDPCLNPDGRERIRSMVVQSAGFRANLDSGAMQRGRWPGGRGNHFLFDMNRDWMAGEAPETRARWAVLREFPPQLFVDAHEMSGLDTFLFYPQNTPRGAHLPERLDHWQKVLAAGSAAAFDRYGWGYYTREWADALAPFYSDAWGSLTGAIGMLYEQGRTIGAPLERESGEIVSYRETVHGQVAASLANLMSFAANRSEILTDYVAHRRQAADPAAPDGGRAFAFAPSADPVRDAHFLRALLEQGIEVMRATEAFEGAACVGIFGAEEGPRAFPAGTWIVPAAQPQGAMVRTYLEVDPRLDADFLREERADLERGKGSRIYDVTAWNLAAQMGIDGAWIDAPSVPSEAAAPATAPAGAVTDLEGGYAWIVEARDQRSLRFCARAMERGLQVHVADEGFEARVALPEGEGVVEFGRGSFLLRRHENPDDVDALVAQVAATTGARVHRALSGRAPGNGADLGGGHFELLEAPKVAMLSNTPVSPSDFGHVWRYVDEDLGLPVTLVDCQGRGVDLSRYNVLIAPPGAGSYLDERAEEMADWVQAGGTLVALDSSAFAIADGESGLGSNRLRRDVLDDLDRYRWRVERERAAGSVEVDLDALYGTASLPADAEAPGEDEDGAGEAESVEDQAPDAGTLDGWRRRFSPAGVILRAEVDPDSWLTGGLPPGPLAVPFGGSRVLMPGERPAVRLSPADQLRLGGLLWPEARARIADSAWLTAERVGRGQVISFVSSPVFRGSWRGTARLLGNAVVLGPGFTR